MPKVFKYPIPWRDTVTITLPGGAQVLDVRPQGTDDALFVWALVDPDATTEPRTFRIAGTGHPIEGHVRHISSFHLQGGALVFHAFEVEGEGS